MKTGKTLTMLMLTIFTGLALYLCPCSFAEPVAGLQITKAPMHDCCEGMSECPLKNQNTPGMKSFLDSFSQDTSSVQISDLHLAQQSLQSKIISSVLNDARPSMDFARHLETHVFKSNPPDFFIQFQSLLI